MFVLFSVAVIFELTLLIKKTKQTLTNNKTSNPYNLEFKKEQNYFTWVKANVCEVSGNLVHELDQSLVIVSSVVTLVTMVRMVTRETASV